MKNNPFFTLIESDYKTSARTGILHTDHGDITTPCFLPIATYGAVKTLSPKEILALEEKKSW